MSRKVLITGASGALGASVVARFLAAGDRVVGVGSGAGAPAGVAAAAAGTATSSAGMAGAAGGGDFAMRHADLAAAGAVERLFAELAADAGEAPAAPPEPVVAHLVGGFRYGRLSDLTDEDWSYLLRVNLETTWRVARACARAFERAGGGVLVVVASPAALLGEAGMGAYAASKAAALRVVESLAREVASHGGRANAVLPGTMDTPANRRAMPQADPAAWVSTAAVAEVIYYLTTPAAAAINGAAVQVPGRTL